jgi:acid phosphatase class B
MRAILRAMTAVCFLLFLAQPAAAVELAGVSIDPTVTVNNELLRLNGSGIRKKLFIKVYVGSLYAARPLSSSAEALEDKGDKLIRMNFLYSKVEKEKIVEAFQEGFRNNSPELAGSPEVKKFLSLFTDDFRKGDVVDLFLGRDGTVTAKHNGKLLGKVVSLKLPKAVLAIYLGEKPADEAMKRGMLGK